MKSVVAMFSITAVAATGVVSACGPVRPAPLTCSISPSAAHPFQNSREIMTIRSVPGVRVLTAAQFASTTLSRTTTINALGFGNTSYDLRLAAPNQAVKVTALVTRGSRRGTCATSFTPVPRPVSPGQPTLPPPPSVKGDPPNYVQGVETAVGLGTINVRWQDANSSLPVDGWRVSRDGVDASGTGAWSTMLPVTASQFTFRNLINTAPYSISVEAHNAAGFGPAFSVPGLTAGQYRPSDGTACDVPGARDYQHLLFCDGFRWNATDKLSVYNVYATKVPGGISLSWTAAMPAHSRLLFLNATVTQLGYEPQNLNVNGGFASSEWQEVTHNQVFYPGVFRTGRSVLNALASISGFRGYNTTDSQTFYVGG